MVKQKILIFARIKPINKTTAVYSVDNQEQTGSSLEFVLPRELADGFVNNKRESYKFKFQKVFDQGITQEEIFEAIAQPVADRVLAGYNGTIFAYGQTGSGKTFTITGGAERYSDRGIIPRTLSYLYQHFSQDSSMMYTTHISYLEIYNEVGYDLLDSQHEASNLEELTKVAILEDPEQNIHLRNLSLQLSANEEEALNLLFLGDTNRMIAETPMNQASTRSHCIFTVHICRREPGSATVRRSKLHLVDLAGSERVSKTSLGGHLLTEAKYINLSLHYLEQVIKALSEKNRSHIPYRNSMMTSVLRDSLGGNCMTTMIATVSIDKRNVDESISTCRFAQRVALIKNEAVLNEEVDPALLLARMRREIVSLKEELSMMTGEQRDDQLTQEDVHQLEELVKAYLEDPDPEATLSLGADMRKIQLCFSLLKARIRDQPDGPVGPSGPSGPDGPDEGPEREEGTQENQDPAQLTKLREMLSQRDKEISILVKMLKKEKKRADDAVAQLENMSNVQREETQRASRSTKQTGEERADIISADRRTGPQLSVGKQEAFEIFTRDQEDLLTIEDNRTVLRQRLAEARALGVRVNEARDRINDLKKQLDLSRRQRAAHGLMGNHTEAEEEPNPEEENLLRQIEREKKTYKSAVASLKALRTEIEHLQLLLQRAKVKLQRDFQEWWSQEASSLQVSDVSLLGSGGAAVSLPVRASSGGDAELHSSSSSSSSSAFAPPLRADSTHSRSFISTNMASLRAEQAWEPAESREKPSSPLRALRSAELLSSSVRLTGDQEADANILAFVRARQELLSRTDVALMEELCRYPSNPYINTQPLQRSERSDPNVSPSVQVIRRFPRAAAMEAYGRELHLESERSIKVV
ncbi:kinesin-like protein KIF6 [Genypterus blacodes]|uniref:kinesin-like protein KIF6 n=1 Tax=Genypterus blacodes TaxID=154954 RepID=UPI003F775F17